MSRWDAENRLLQITYPGTGNNSQFVYDPLSRNVRIDETTGGGTPTVKQFVWCGAGRCEERDGSGGLAKEFFARGQLNGNTKYFYSTDRLGSITEMSDNSGVVQAQYKFDPFGRVTKLQSTAESDFQFTGNYVHARTGLVAAVYRFYSPSLGRWLSRDPAEEGKEINLYTYVSNGVTNYVDSLGLMMSAPIPPGDKKPPDKKPDDDTRTPRQKYDDCVEKCKQGHQLREWVIKATRPECDWDKLIKWSEDIRDQCIRDCGPQPPADPQKPPPTEDNSSVAPPGGGDPFEKRKPPDDLSRYQRPKKE